MNTETKTIALTIILIFLTFFIPLPFWSILWLDVVIVSTLFMYDFRAPLIVAIILICVVLVLWILGQFTAANRLTHFAFLWTLFGVMKMAFSNQLVDLKKKIFHVKGDILGELYHEADPVVNLLKETIVLLIITGTYVTADIFVNQSWWMLMDK